MKKIINIVVTDSRIEGVNPDMEIKIHNASDAYLILGQVSRQFDVQEMIDSDGKFVFHLKTNNNLFLRRFAYEVRSKLQEYQDNESDFGEKNTDYSAAIPFISGFIVYTDDGEHEPLF